jgi:glycine/D-amino acid oxidase-like deaminating enzyme
MTDQPADVIVVGAGAAGLCCAAELLLHGKVPLLVSETSEVAHAFRSVFFGKNRGTAQALAWQAGFGGGWWGPLARKLDLPVTFRHYIPVESTIIGSDKFTSVPLFATSSAFAQVLSEAAPSPLSEKVLEGITASLRDGMDLPYEELFSLDRTRLFDWLLEHGADHEGAAIVTAFLGRTFALEPEDSVEHLSVTSGIGVLRLMFSGDGKLCEIYPDPREGVWIPMATEIERRRGQILRGTKVDRIIIESGRATGIRLVDGTELHAADVALATSNERMAKFFDVYPTELQEALDYPAPKPVRQVGFYILVDHVVMKRPAALSINDEDGRTLTYVIPQHESNVEEGKQVLLIALNNAGDRDDDELLAESHAILERAFPDYAGSVLDVGRLTYTPSHWMDYTTVGPKLQRQSPSTEGLWYVGEGGWPVVGVWTEAAAGSGIVGARLIAAGRA